MAGRKWPLGIISHKRCALKPEISLEEKLTLAGIYGILQVCMTSYNFAGFASAKIIEIGYGNKRKTCYENSF